MHPVVVCLSSFGGSLAGSIVPIISSEAILLGLAATAPAALATPILVLAVLGQMVGKTAFFMAGRGVFRLPKGKRWERVNDVAARLEKRRGLAGAILFASALAGVPPFFLMPVACGMIGLSFPLFLLLGTAGRLVRFGAIVYFPHALMGLFA
ncbi:MAG TPA: hypothetical protein VFQ38_12960 [Longimicrobiales bacterium]|nr:hypothetical protein [Longimicrobiales bacterium]